MSRINGYCDSRFEAVRNAFIENFESRGEIGASVAIFLEGQPVVDLWGGYMDAECTVSWRADTVVNVWSLGKAMTALAVLKAVEQGYINLEDTIATHWPEFKHQGKGDITIAAALAHRAGLPALEQPLPNDAFFDWDLMTGAIATQAPWWEPGTNHGYHTNTFGFLLGETLRCAVGQRIRDFFHDNIARPLDVDFFMGIPAAEERRVATLSQSPRPDSARNPVANSGETNDDLMARMRQLVYTNPPILFDDEQAGMNSRAWRMAEFPSTSPQSNARSVAAIFGHLANMLHRDESGIINLELLKRAIRTQSDGEDLVVQRPTRFGLGFQLTQPDRPLGPNAGTFGHYGNGGHLGFADPTVPLGFAYHMNLQGYAWRDPRNIALTDAMYDCLP